MTGNKLAQASQAGRSDLALPHNASGRLDTVIGLFGSRTHVLEAPKVTTAGHVESQPRNESQAPRAVLPSDAVKPAPLTFVYDKSQSKN
jgi:hypothetical protein